MNTIKYNKITIKGNDNKIYELQIKQGNNKPIPTNTAIISMSSAFNCICGYLDLCPHHRFKTGNCYALKYELNPMFKQKTLNRRKQDTEALQYIINDMPNGAEYLAAEIIKINNQARKHKIKYLRWNESGDIKDLKEFKFIDAISNILYKELGIITVLYTHRRDLKDQINQVRTSKGLIILGSDYMQDLEFKAVDSTEELKQYKYTCCSDCIKCHQEHGTAHCYNKELTHKNITIAEKLRTNKKTAAAAKAAITGGK